MCNILPVHYSQLSQLWRIPWCPSPPINHVKIAVHACGVNSILQPRVCFGMRWPSHSSNHYGPHEQSVMNILNVPCVTNPQHSLNAHNFAPSNQPALPLYIPPCVTKPSHPFHLPPVEQPLRIHIEGPLLALRKLLPGVSWHVANYSPDFPMSGGPKLAELAFQQIYHRKVRHDVAGDMVVRDEYMGWVDKAMYVNELLFSQTSPLRESTSLILF
jgi:hypothetical protein